MSTSSATSRTGADRQAAGPLAHPAVTLALILGAQLMVILDATVVNIALPDIKSALGFSPTGLSWVLNTYTLAFGGLLLLGGRAGDILGRRRVLLAGTALFTLASLVGGLAQSSEWLLAARTAQGVGAAFAAPSTMSLIMSNFPEGPRRTRAIALFSAVNGSGLAVGLMVGGMLTQWGSWRWVMFVNVPIGALIWLLAPRFISETERHPGRFDMAGALTATLGMTSLVYAFIRASTDGWSDPLSVGAFVAAAVLLGGFVATETRARQPIMPLRLLADRDRVGAYAAFLLIPAAMFGAYFFLTQFLQEQLGFSPLRAGFAFLPMAVCFFGFARLAPVLLPRTGRKPLIAVGTGLTIAATAWLAQISPDSGYAGLVLGPMLLVGSGFGLLAVPLNLTIVSGVQPRDTGAAVGILQSMQQVGGSLGLAIMVTVSDSAARHAAHDGFVHGLAAAFTTATVFAAVGMAVGLLVIRKGLGRPVTVRGDQPAPERS